MGSRDRFRSKHRKNLMTRSCLIAEADLFIVNLLLRFAKESGLQSMLARTGEEILPMVQRLKPAVLIVEPELPGEVRGWEAVRAMQIDPAIDHIAIISCSWLNRTDSCELIGDVAGHLQKPNLHYVDFVKAMVAAGVAIDDHGDGEPNLLGSEGEQAGQV
jgi:uncharacterized protein YihD (DUF1040 family)